MHLILQIANNVASLLYFDIINAACDTKFNEKWDSLI